MLCFVPKSSTLRSPSSPIQEEDEEKLSEMSDAQPHTMLLSSPAPTDVSHPFTSWHLNPAAKRNALNQIFSLLQGHSNWGRGRIPVSRWWWLYLIWHSTEQFKMWQWYRFVVFESWINWHFFLPFWVVQRTGWLLGETSYRTAAANTAAWPKQRATRQATCHCQVRKDTARSDWKIFVWSHVLYSAAEWALSAASSVVIALLATNCLFLFFNFLLVHKSLVVLLHFSS